MAADGRAEIRDMVRLSWDDHDLKSSALIPLFDLCEALVRLNRPTVPTEVGYRPGLALDGYPDGMVEELMIGYYSGTIAEDDMVHWVRTLDRYMDLHVRGTDRDY